MYSFILIWFSSFFQIENHLIILNTKDLLHASALCVKKIKDGIHCKYIYFFILYCQILKNKFIREVMFRMHGTIWRDFIFPTSINFNSNFKFEFSYFCFEFVWCCLAVDPQLLYTLPEPVITVSRNVKGSRKKCFFSVTLTPPIFNGNEDFFWKFLKFLFS